MVANRRSGGSNSDQRSIDVGCATQPKPEVYDDADPAGLARFALEDEYVPTAWCLGLDEIVLLVDGDDTKYGLIEPQGTARIANGECNVR